MMTPVRTCEMQVIRALEVVTEHFDKSVSTLCDLRQIARSRKHQRGEVWCRSPIRVWAGIR